MKADIYEKNAGTIQKRSFIFTRKREIFFFSLCSLQQSIIKKLRNPLSLHLWRRHRMRKQSTLSLASPALQTLSPFTSSRSFPLPIIVSCSCFFKMLSVVLFWMIRKVKVGWDEIIGCLFYIVFLIVIEVDFQNFFKLLDDYSVCWLALRFLFNSHCFILKANCRLIFLTMYVLT